MCTINDTVTFIGCSDMFACNTSSNFFGIGHNEDEWNGTLTTGYFVNATITNGTSYFAFQYPGYLAGNALSVNNYSLVLTVNALFPNNVSVENSRGIYLIARNILDCNDLQCATNAITGQTKVSTNKHNKNGSPVSTYGASFNIGLKQDGIIVNAEISNFEYSFANCSNYGFHFNNYVRILDISSTNDCHYQEAITMRSQEPIFAMGLCHYETLGGG